MALVGFEQDPHPDAPQGAGWFMADSGERAYAHDPELASSFFNQPEQPSEELMAAGQEDPRLAFGTGPAGQDFNAQNLAADAGGAQQAAPPSMADVGPNMSPAPAQGPMVSQAAPGMSAPGPQAPQGPPQAQRPPPGEVDPDEQLRAQQQAYVNQPVRGAASPGGYRPRTSEESFTDAGLPLDPEQAAELARYNENIKVAKQAETGLLVARAQEQMASAQAAIPDLVMKQKEAEARLQQAQNGARQDLQKVKDLIQATNEKKVDPGRMFQGGKGVVAGIFAVMAQAFGAYAAIKSKTGRNFGGELVQQAIDRDIAAQKEEIDQGRVGANNMLAVLQKKYDYDLPQAESALRMAQTGVVQQQLRAFEGGKLSQDAMANLGTWQADLEKQQFMEARKLYEAGLGKHSRKVNLQYQAPSGGGLAAPTEAERQKRLGTIKLAQETGTMLKPGEGKEQIDPATVIYGVDGKPVAATSPKSADDVRKQYKLYKQAKPSLNKLQELAGLGKSFNWNDSAAYAIHLENVINTANTIAGQGVVRSDDIDRYKTAIAQGGLGAKRALAELSGILDNTYQSSVDAETGPSVAVDFGKGKPRATYTKKRAATPTVGRGAAGSDATPDDLKNALEAYK